MTATHNLRGTSYPSFRISKDGPTIHRGVEIPSNIFGNDGDLYIKIGASSSFYQKANGTWTRFSNAARSIIPISQNYLSTLEDDIILVDTNSNPVTITLSNISTEVGKTLAVKDAGGNASTNNITIAGESNQSVDGSLTHIINQNYESVTLLCDGDGWLII